MDILDEAKRLSIRTSAGPAGGSRLCGRPASLSSSSVHWAKKTARDRRRNSLGSSRWTSSYSGACSRSGGRIATWSITSRRTNGNRPSTNISTKHLLLTHLVQRPDAATAKPPRRRTILELLTHPLVQRPDAVLVVRLAALLDDVAVVVNNIALLLAHEAVEELEERARLRQVLDERPGLGRREHLRD